AALGKEIVDRLDLVRDDELLHEIRRHQRDRRRLAGLVGGLRLEARIVVAAGIDGGHLDVVVAVVELLDDSRHLAGERALHRHRKVKIDGGLGDGRRGDAERGCEAERGDTQAKTSHGLSPPHLMPENMKLLMNWRWKTTKAASSGSDTRSVPAAIRPH